MRNSKGFLFLLICYTKGNKSLGVTKILSSKRVVLPLVGSSFLPKKAKECVEIVEKYLNHEDVY